MADSHGEADTIRQAIDLFAREGCYRWIHLGDICDTDQPATVRACLAFLDTPQAEAVCGNNDNTLRLNQGDRLAPALQSKLAALPLTLEIDNVILAHSLPFAAHLGVSCTRGIMDRDRALAFFRQHPGCHLMRGHAHRPERIRRVGDRIRYDVPVPGQVLRLEGRRPSILTCGALTDGWVMIWDRPGAKVQYLRLA